jgi:hypothetical protein
MALFSMQELDLASEPTWLLMKSRIFEKLQEQFQEIEQAIAHYLMEENVRSSIVQLKSGKISKGENYRGLAYMVLDYPRFFSTEDVFTFRSMFLWGHHISFSLQLHGRFKDAALPYLLNNYEVLQQDDKLNCYIHIDPWQYLNQESYYKNIQFVDKDAFKTLVDELDFIKLTHFYPIHLLEKTPQLAVSVLSKWMKLLDYKI